MNDTRLKPRMLRSLIRDHLPDEKRPFPSSPELASVLSQVKTHGLLSERDLNPDPNPKVVDTWRFAVDEWVDRLISLISSNMPDKCWAGICLLGVTCENCTSQRFLMSYSFWFQKLLSNIQVSRASTHFVKVASCASLADLLTRLASFPNVKKDATSLAGKLIQPILNLLEDGAESVWEGAINLLSTAIISFPSSIHRHYDNVEAVLVSKIMLAKSNRDMSKKFACCLSLLPKVKGDEDSWSLLIHKILISIHFFLTDAFQGLEEEAKSSDIMRLLVPPGKDPPPPLGGQLMSETSKQATNVLPGLLIPQVSTLMHCCCMMLSTPYPVQVTVPIHNLLALVGRVLCIDGSLQGSLLPFTTTMHQELLCAELPALHLDSLDLLVAIIKGVRSQLLPHAASIARLLTEYFRGTTLPSIRTKVYFIMHTLLISMGVGMALYLAHDVIDNAFADLNDCPGDGALSFTLYLTKSTSEPSQQSSHRKRKHASGTPTEQPDGVNVGAVALDRKMLSPLSVKMGALKALESLLTVGGSLRSEHWRSNVDSLLIKVAMNACDVGWASEEEYTNLRDETPVSRADFQHAALEALLASLLSPSRVRPPYLSQGLELFRRGKQETGTKLAVFCAHALLALEILIHPRALPLVDAPVTNNSALDERLNHNHENPNMSLFSRGNLGSINDLYDDDDDLYNSWLGDELTMGDNNATTHMENQEQFLRGSMEGAILEKNSVDEQVRGDVDAETGQEKMHTADVEMASTDRDANIDTHPEPASSDLPEVDKDYLRFTSGSSHNNDLGTSSNLISGGLSSNKIGPDNSTLVSSNNSNLNKHIGSTSESLGVLFKDPEGRDHDSDSSSIGSLPDIVDGDPDSDD